jgi:hypothetical protein
MEQQLDENSSLEDADIHDDNDFKETVDTIKMPTFDFTEKTWKDDFVLIVESKRLHVTKAILAHASPVFETMFHADFKEKNNTALELPGKTVEDVQKFLRCIYPDPVDVCSENINSVLPLAEEYQVSNLKSRCEAFLLKQVKGVISFDDLYSILGQSSQYNMPNLVKKCVELVSNTDFESYKRADRRTSVNPEVKCMILERMVSRLQPKNFLEVVKGYYEVYLNSNQKVNIENYKDWDGSFLDINVSVHEETPFELILHGIKAQCSITIGHENNPFGDDSSKITIESSTIEEDEVIKVFGQISIQPINKECQVVSRHIEFTLRCDTEVKKNIPNLICEKDFKKMGFVFHDELHMKMYFLAKRDT